MRQRCRRTCLATAIGMMLTSTAASAGRLGVRVAPIDDGGAVIHVEVGPEHEGRLVCVGGPGRGFPPRGPDLGGSTPWDDDTPPIYLAIAGARGVPPLTLSPDDVPKYRRGQLKIILAEPRGVSVSADASVVDADQRYSLGRFSARDVGEGWIRVRDLPSVDAAMERMRTRTPSPLRFASPAVRAPDLVGAARVQIGAEPSEVSLAVERELDEGSATAVFRLAWHLPDDELPSFLIMALPRQPFMAAVEWGWPESRTLYSAPTLVRRISGAGEATLRVPGAWLRWQSGVALPQEPPQSPEMWSVTIARSVETWVWTNGGSGAMRFTPDALADDRWYASDAGGREVDLADWPSLDRQLLPEGVDRNGWLWTMLEDTRATLTGPDEDAGD